MTTYRLRAAVALIVVAFAASACGDDSGSGGPSYEDSVSTAHATWMAEGATHAATDAINDFDFGEPSYGFVAPLAARVMSSPAVVAAQGRKRHLGPLDPSRLDWRAAIRQAPAGTGLQLVMEDHCTYTGHGLESFNEYDPTDANGNDIADDMLFEYKCTEPGEGTEVDTWGLRVTIKENTSSLWGYTLRWKYYERWDSGDGDFEVETYEQADDLDVRSGSAGEDWSFKYSYASRTDGVDFNEGNGESWSADFDPDAAIAEGSTLPDGDLRLSGHRFDYETDAASYQFDVSTTTVLRHSAACEVGDDFSPFSSGVLHGKLNGNSGEASFNVTLTGCTTFTVDIDGAYDEPVEAAR